MSKIDTQKLLDDNPIENVIARHITLKQDGIHLKGRCPFHDDHKASLVVTPSKSLAKCFACGWNGDAIDFVMQIDHLGFREACEDIETGATSKGDWKTIDRASLKRVSNWSNAIAPGPPQSIKHSKYGTPSITWPYYDADGGLLGYVCRFDHDDGTKDVIPYTFKTDGNISCWRWQGLDAPRVMYNLHLLKKYPDATIILVEGEKTADAVSANLDRKKTIVITWPGGSNAIKYIDFSPLVGRKIIAIPDNDVQGLAAMLNIARQVPFISITPLDNTLPKGWDPADKDWKDGELRAWILKRIVTDIPPNVGDRWEFKQIDRDVIYNFGYDKEQDLWTFIKVDAPEPAPIPDAPEPAPIPDAPEPAPIPDAKQSELKPQKESPLHELYFRFLGYDKTDAGQQSFYFLSKLSQQVIRLNASSVSDKTLLQIAPLSYWQDRFNGRKPFDTTAALNWIIIQSTKVGPFRDKYIRGRGAWMDRGRVVLHGGDRLIVDGIAANIGSFDSKYIYELDEDMGYRLGKPLAPSEAKKLLDLLRSMSWDREVNPFLLAGWCVIAPVCGALTWRPHIWLTGAAGTGKSWIFNKVIRKLLGNTGICVQGETSEPGLRQMLRHDALPVVFDEAEGADKKAHDRMQQVMGLMRSSSSEDGGDIAKGSSAGIAKTFRIRSCFAFASIAVQLSQQSDRTRVTVIGLKKYAGPDKQANWEGIQRNYNDLMTDDFILGLQARTIKMLPIILKNSTTFSNAAAAELGAQRVGDQLGALLAGAFSLASDKLISYDNAVKFIRARDWSEERGLESTSDEFAILEYLMNILVAVDTQHGRYERTVAELISITAYRRVEKAVEPKDAEDRMKRLGFKIKDDFVLISNTAEWIKRQLRDTSWPQNHNKILQRVPGAVKFDSTRFSTGLETRAIGIPLAMCIDMD